MHEKYEPMDMKELADILSLTIKEDDENKIIAFLCQLSAFTEDSQFNVLFNAPSSSGKSYIPLEVSKLFPSEDVIKLGHSSPTAFLHEQGDFDEKTNTTTIDFAKKILIFLDMQNTALLERLRSFLSHDEKETMSKITDKNDKGGNRTKTIILKGFPSVIFCSAGSNIDEQELTRFLVLSPEVTTEKIDQGVSQAIKKSVSPEDYQVFLNSDPRRTLLKERILDIRNAHIGDIRILDQALIKKHFIDNTDGLKPRHQRDIHRFISLIKSIALLNYYWRDKTETGGIIANESDILEAVKIWEKISISQEMNIPPYVHSILVDVIRPLWKEKLVANRKDVFKNDDDCGITRNEIQQRYFVKYNRLLGTFKLRMEVLKTLETAGIITQEQDPSNRRAMLVYPATDTEEYSVNEVVVNHAQIQEDIQKVIGETT